jgi:acetyl esterase/lipase
MGEHRFGLGIGIFSLLGAVACGDGEPAQDLAGAGGSGGTQITVGGGGQGGGGDGDPCTADAAYDTRAIAPLGEATSKDGWITELYTNEAYRCGDTSIAHGFLFAYPASHRGKLHEPAPLWLFLHGGGFGYFDEQGVYQPPGLASFLEETPSKLVPGELAGLRKRVLAKGFRYLAVTLCDHDTYSGVGCLDPHNPSADARTEGLLAVASALAFVEQRAATAHVFAHGTSAGGVGVLSLAHYLGRRGRKLAGIVPDSGDFSRNFAHVVEQAQCKTWVTPEILAGFVAKTGPYATAGLLPEDGVVGGSLDTPIHLIYSRQDRACNCGLAAVDGVDLDGQAIQGEACFVSYRPLVQAIERHNPGGASRAHVVCVDGETTDPGGQGYLAEAPCDLHSVTLYDGVDTEAPAGEEDYNAQIVAWVDERLRAPVP